MISRSRAVLVIALAASSLLSGVRALTTQPHADAAGPSACPVTCITEYPVPSASTTPPSPSGIVAGPDGTLWFHEASANKIGRITPGGQIREYTIPTPNCCSQGFLGVGPDGAIWFSEDLVSKLGRITASGQITEYSIPPPGYVLALAVGPDHALWFTRLQLPGTFARPLVTSSAGPGSSASFTVSFNSSAPGQGEVYFGSGPGCSGLVEVATQDLHNDTTQHSVVVTGNDLASTVGDVGILPGTTYWFEAVTVTRNGTETDNNGGKCYSVTVPVM